MRIIKERLYNKLDANQGQEQAERSTIDQIFIVNQLIEKAKEYRFDMYFLFIDFYEAFDSIQHDTIWKALRRQGIEEKMKRLTLQ